MRLITLTILVAVAGLAFGYCAELAPGCIAQLCIPGLAVVLNGIPVSFGHGRDTVGDDEPLTLIEAAKIWPGRPNVKTLRRYAQDGCRGVKLKTFRVGGCQLATTRRAIQDFLAALNGENHANDEYVDSLAALDSLGVS